MCWAAQHWELAFIQYVFGLYFIDQGRCSTKSWLPQGYHRSKCWAVAICQALLYPLWWYILKHSFSFYKDLRQKVRQLVSSSWETESSTTLTFLIAVSEENIFKHFIYFWHIVMNLFSKCFGGKWCLNTCSVELTRDLSSVEWTVSILFITCSISVETSCFLKAN